MEKRYFEVVKEFLDSNGEDVTDFVVLNDDVFNTYEEALDYANNKASFYNDDGNCNITIYEDDEDMNLIDAWIIKTNRENEGN